MVEKVVGLFIRWELSSNPGVGVHHAFLQACKGAGLFATVRRAVCNQDRQFLGLCTDRFKDRRKFCRWAMIREIILDPIEDGGCTIFLLYWRHNRRPSLGLLVKFRRFSLRPFAVLRAFA